MQVKKMARKQSADGKSGDEPEKKKPTKSKKKAEPHAGQGDLIIM
jgi:hypothetical protein